MNTAAVTTQTSRVFTGTLKSSHEAPTDLWPSVFPCSRPFIEYTKMSSRPYSETRRAPFGLAFARPFAFVVEVPPVTYDPVRQIAFTEDGTAWHDVIRAATFIPTIEPTSIPTIMPTQTPCDIDREKDAEPDSSRD